MERKLLTIDPESVMVVDVGGFDIVAARGRDGNAYQHWMTGGTLVEAEKTARQFNQNGVGVTYATGVALDINRDMQPATVTFPNNRVDIWKGLENTKMDNEVREVVYGQK